MRIIKMSLFLILVFVATIVISTISYAAEYKDVSSISDYYDSVMRVSSLGIMIGDNNGKFMPDSTITREQYAKVISKIAGWEGETSELSGFSLFSDVKANRWSCKYINFLSQKKIMGVTVDGKFRPESEMTYAEGCTVFVKALGFNDSDVEGTWPQNYIQKAMNLGIIQEDRFLPTDKLPRWMAAKMADRLWLIRLRGGEIDDLSVVEQNAPGVFSECILFSDESISKDLDENQIVTDLGVLYNFDKGVQIEYGNKYKIIKANDTIYKIYKPVKKVKNVTIKSFDNHKIYCDIQDRTETIFMPSNAIYYYNGKKSSYEQLEEVLKFGSSAVFVYNEYSLGYEHITIFDPIYSKPEIVNESFDYNSQTKKGGIDFSLSLPVIKNNENITIEEICIDDVIYMVCDIWGNKKFIFVCNDKNEGAVKDFLPNRLTPKFIRVEDKLYELSNNIELNEITSLSLNDNVMLLIGYNEKVEKVRKLGYPKGNKQEIIILGNSKTSIELMSNQYLTDKGLYIVDESIPALELGAKYSVVVNPSNNIVHLETKLTETYGITVLRTVGRTVTYEQKELVQQMILPKGIDYYYQGDMINNYQINEVLQFCTSIILSYENEDKSDYSYAVIIDPLYSKPEIFSSYDLANGKIGDLAIDANNAIIRNNEIIGIGDISKNDIVYIVQDIWNKNAYTLVVNKTVYGQFTDIIPNILSSRALLIGHNTYGLSEYFEYNKLKEVKVGSEVTIYLGYDNKVVNITK